jgi:hypothetical protein
VTYDDFAAAWPNMIEQTGEYGVMMNLIRENYRGRDNQA